MSAPKMPEIRQTIDRARAVAGREDTEQFALEAPGLLARLVEILDLYVGHEPTTAEEAAYVRAEVRREVLAEAEAKAREVVAKLWGDGTTQRQLDRAGGARAVEWEIGLLAAGKDIPAGGESTRAVCGQRGSRDAGLPCDLVCMKAAGHVDAGDPWHDMVPGTEAPACGRCHRPFDPSDTRFDGHAQHCDTPFCRSCVDRCHESTDAFHQCPVCSGSGEAGESR